MLKRLKLKSLLPSSALRSNSAALRLSKTPPQGGVFVSDTEPFPGWRLTPYPGYKYSQTSFRATNPNTALTRSPGKRSATGEQTVPVPQPPGHHSGQPTQTPALTRSPGKHSATGEQTVPVPQPPGHHSGQPTQTPHLPVAPVSAAPPGNKRCQCRRPFRRSVNKVFYVCHCPVPGEWQT